MNDEIKEILDFKENADYKRLSCDEIKILRDYITNLQQENEKLKWDKEQLNSLVNSCQDEIRKLKELDENYPIEEELAEAYRREEDYKSRIEKTVEYIQNHQLVFELSSKKVISQWFDMFYKDTLNILNGRSDE